MLCMRQVLEHHPPLDRARGLLREQPPRLVEAPLVRGGDGERNVPVDRSQASLSLVLRPTRVGKRLELRPRRRAVVHSGPDLRPRPLLEDRMARALGVDEGALRHSELLVETPVPEEHVRERVVAGGEHGVVGAAVGLVRAECVTDLLLEIDQAHAARVPAHERPEEERGCSDVGRTMLGRVREHPLGFVELPRRVEDATEVGQHRDRVRIVLGQERERAPEQPRCRMDVLSVSGATAGGAETECRAPRQPGRGFAELLAVQGGLLEVVAEDLVELDEVASALLDPRREALVEVGTLELRQRLVGGVADQQVAETKRIVAGQRRRRGPDELLAHEPEQVPRNPRVVRRERLHRAPVEDLSLDRTALESRALRARKLVEPCCEQRLDRRRNDDVPGAARRHRQHLLDEERIAAGGVADPVTQLPVERDAGEQPVDERVGLGLGQRLEEHRRRVELPARPAGPAFEQFRPGEAEQQDRRVSRPVRNMLDEIEERRLAPVQVVEDDDQRPLAGRLLEQFPHGDADLVRGRVAVTEQRGERPVGRPPVAEQLRDHLDDGPVRDAVAVGEAAATHDGRVESRDELLREPRLPDPGDAQHGEERTRPLGPDALPGVVQHAPFALASDKRHVAPARNRVAVGHRQEPVRGQRLRLPLRLDGRHRLHLDRVADQRERADADQHLARRSRLFEPCGDVDRIAGDERVAAPRDDLAGVDADAHRDLCGVTDLRSGTSRTQRVVLAHGRDAEDGHHGVADEFLERPAVTFDRGPCGLEVGAHHAA